MSHPGSLHKTSTKLALLATAALSGLIALAELPVSTSRSPFADNVRQTPAIEAASEVNGAAVLGIALAGSAAIGVGLTALVERDRLSSSQRLPLGRSTPKASVSFGQVSRPLQRKLLRLLHEDQGAAHRLFVHASLKYPGKDPDWYAEKIIYDLARDRGKY